MARRRTGILGEYAGFVTRAAALIMDIALISVIVFVLNAVVALPLVFFLRVDIQTCTLASGETRVIAATLCRSVHLIWLLVAVLTAPIYFIFFFTTSGQTIGKYFMGLRVVRLDGRPMTATTSIIRWLGYFVSLIPFGLGFVWVIIDARRQGFHDIMAKTAVIYAWRGQRNEFVLDKVRQWFASRRKPEPVPGTLAPARQTYDLVALAVAELGRVPGVLNMLQDMVVHGEIVVVSTLVLAKAADGGIGVVGTGDLAGGDQYAQLIGGRLELSSQQNAAIAQDLPANNFIVAVLLEEQWADVLVRQVSRKTTILMRRYDLSSDTMQVAAIPAESQPSA